MAKLRLLLGLWLLLAPFAAPAQEPIGIVIMHGKGGSPNSKHIAEFARRLEAQGLLVANLEMPWSGRRNYDVPVARAEEEVEAALEALRGRGAKKLFVAGHSQGGAFAIHFAGRVALDGVVAIAPGGSVATAVFREQLAASLARARQLVAEGKGAEPQRLEDYEASHGRYPVIAIPAAYVTWFDPDGAMNMLQAAQRVNPRTPVLFIIPKRDYPGLLKTSPAVFRALPPNPLSRLQEPDADHFGAPVAAVDGIVRWTREVAAR
jgi:dienelactone hydrolase